MQGGIWVSAAHTVLFCAARVIPFATPLSHLQHPSALALNTPRLFSSSPSHVVTFLSCLPGLPAGQEGGISVDLGSLCGDVLLLWCPGWWRARNSFILCLPISISCGNVLFFVPLLNFSWNERYLRVLEEGQDSWLPQSPNTSCPGNEDNGVCAAAFPKLSWQFR